MIAIQESCCRSAEHRSYRAVHHLAPLTNKKVAHRTWLGEPLHLQKTDRQDAQLILRLLVEDRFPRIWVPSWENRDLRQLLWHRHRMVQARTRIMNQLQAVALNEGVRSKKPLWRDAGRAQLEAFVLAPWASQRRRDLLELLDRLKIGRASCRERV